MTAEPREGVVRLSADDDLGSFDCGSVELNRWLSQFSLSDQRARASVTYVLKRGRRVVGFFAVAPHAVEPSSAHGRLAAGQPRHRPILVLLLARLGVDVSEQGSGLGAALLRDALARCAVAADGIGGRAVVVHAKDDAAIRFYHRFGFVPLPDNPNHLYVLIKDVKASIREAGG